MDRPGLPEHGLAPGSDVDAATLRNLAGYGEIADLPWEAPDALAAGHARVFEAVIAAYQAAEPVRAEDPCDKSGPSGRVPGRRTVRRWSSCTTG